mmetsp:Transcript_12862/g.40402  ORF Transcript_12862/g.40402 Transcript_12862/m.40402 type:complete len:200 (+) Transcript_12862:1296-1895(+)
MTCDTQIPPCPASATRRPISLDTSMCPASAGTTTASCTVLPESSSTTFIVGIAERGACRSSRRILKRVQMSSALGSRGIMARRSRMVLLPLLSSPMTAMLGGCHFFSVWCSKSFSGSRLAKMRLSSSIARSRSGSRSAAGEARGRSGEPRRPCQCCSIARASSTSGRSELPIAVRASGEQQGPPSCSQRSSHASMAFRL